MYASIAIHLLPRSAGILILAEIRLKLWGAFTPCKSRVNIAPELLLKVTHMVHQNSSLLYLEQGRHTPRMCSQSSGPTELLEMGKEMTRQD